ncbi:hypothetical protein BJX65DRAFT_307822 [Aspergillus insuetus]
MLAPGIFWRMHWLEEFPTEAPNSRDFLSALLTFEVIFGVVYGSREQIFDGIDIVDTVLADAQALFETISPDNPSSPPTYDWYCSNEQWLTQLGGNRYLDKKSPRGEGQNEIEFVCTDDSEGLVAFTTHYEDLIDTPNAIDRLTFCPRPLERLGLTLQEVRQTTYEHEQGHLEHLEELTEGLNLIHEIAHLQIALYINGAYRDVGWAEGPHGKAYGWAGIRGIKPALSRGNAKSFAYWVIAMYLARNDWHTGYSLRLENLPAYGTHLNPPDEDTEEDTSEDT